MSILDKCFLNNFHKALDICNKIGRFLHHLIISCHIENINIGWTTEIENGIGKIREKQII